jgi:hypothetical protein
MKYITSIDFILSGRVTGTEDEYTNRVLSGKTLVRHKMTLCSIDPEDNIHRMIELLQFFKNWDKIGIKVHEQVYGIHN